MIVESPIAATWRSVQHEKAVLVGIGPGIEEADLDELAALAESAGAEPVGRVVQSRTEPDHQFWIGKGKVEQLHDLVHTPARSSSSSTRSSRRVTCGRSKRAWA